MANIDEAEDRDDNPDQPDLNDPRKVARRKRRADAQDDLRRRYVATQLSTPEGRLWFRELLLKCNALPCVPETGHSLVPGDPYALAFNEGARGIGWWVLRDIDPDMLPALIKGDDDGK